MRLLLILLTTLIYSQLLKAEDSQSQFLPSGFTYNKQIPDPETWFGFKPGDRHLSYDQVLAYAHEIARLSERVIITEYARSHEFRPLVHLIFTSEENHRQLNSLKGKHSDYIQTADKPYSSDIPLVVLLGYGVHGNESSATNASVLTMYFLAAAQGSFIDSLLRQTIILVDPCLNPDGFNRHSTWVNMHQGNTDVSDPAARGFTESWPGGRGNHYWFDLNRDYLFLVHPESAGRIEKFHEWLPGIVTDHHEMGANSTFFFQPGIPSRNNPRVPQKKYELTNRIADFHRAKFDSRGELYYSEESFDDYYLGKGSSYPDINGSIGILFEQAGYRGKIRETIYGKRTFAQAIKNQFDVSLSTLEAALRLKKDILQNQQEFYAEALKLAQNDQVKGYIVGEQSDFVRLYKLSELLAKHRIKHYAITSPVTANGIQFQPGKSFFVPLDQPQYRLIKSLFETVETFTDSTFYDVSTWNLPMAFNLTFEPVSATRELQKVSDKLFQHSIADETGMKGKADSYAWVMKWDNYNAPAALWQLQQKGMTTMVATREFSVLVNGINETFGYGTIVIPTGIQAALSKQQIFDILKGIATECKVSFTGITSGHTASGIDIGSGSLMPLVQPKILMVAGESVNSREAGEIWHLFDQRFRIPATMTDITAIRNLNLNSYTTLILPGGTMQRLSKDDGQKIRQWVAAGGTLITIGDAAQWASDQEIASIRFKRPVAADTGKVVPYVNRAEEAAIHAIAGAILSTEPDITHPIGYGYSNKILPVFKTGTRVAEVPTGSYTSPVKFSARPWLSGYISDRNLDRIKNAPSVTVIRNGNGRVISFMESPNFRGIWLGTHKMFANAVFFGQIIR